MRKKILIPICSVLSSLTWAGNMGPVFNDNTWSKVASLSLAPGYTSPGELQTIYLQPDVAKTYTSNFNTAVLFGGELFLGGQRSINDALYGQLGLAIEASTPATVSGVVWEDANINENNYTYQYAIQHEHLAVKGKLLSQTDLFASPYISGSIGVGFNTSHGFKVAPIIVQEVPPGPFQSNTSVAFVYTIGAGFQKSIDKHWQAGIGYELADWGHSALGRAPEQTINNGPQLSHLYTQQLQFNITYLTGE